MRIEKREKKQEDIIEVQSPVRIAQGDHDVLLEKETGLSVVSESDVTLIPRILQDYQRTAASAKKRGGYVEIDSVMGLLRFSVVMEARSISSRVMKRMTC